MQFTIEGIEVTIENRLAKKLDIMCDRVMKKHPALDSCIENSGFEGEGKTNVSIIEAAYIKWKTGRPINLFMLTSSAAKFMQNSEEGLVILDEPSFETLSSDANSSRVKDLLRLTSTMRVMRHFLIINFAKFWKFPEFLVVDRSLGMVHLDSKGGREPGRFIYIRKKHLERLWNDYKRHGIRTYNKYRSFGGQFSYKMEELFDKLDITVEGKPHSTFQDYQDAKMKAISDIGSKERKKDHNLFKLLALRKKIGMAEPSRFGLTKEKFAMLIGTDSKTIRSWSNIDLKNPKDDDLSPNTLENQPFRASGGGDLLILGGENEKSLQNAEEEVDFGQKKPSFLPEDDVNDL